jgi:hypothetical protein
MLMATAANVRIATSAGSDDTAATEDNSKLLWIRSKGKYGLIDRTGNLILPPQYNSLFGYDSSQRAHQDEWLDADYSQGLRAVEIDNKWGYIDKDAKVIIQPQYAMAGPFREGRAQVRVSDPGRTGQASESAWGIIDRDGKFVVEPQYSFIGPFCGGLARIAVGGSQVEVGLPRSQWGFINEKGDQIIPPKYEYAHSFSNGRALVNVGGRWRGGSGLSFQDGRWGVIDESGKFVVEPKIEIDSPDTLNESESTGDAELIPVKYEGKFGYRDRQWNLVIEPQFDKAMPFSEQLAAVMLAGKFGYINTTGRWTIHPQFQAAGEFSEGLAAVVTTTGACLVDKDGKETPTVECDDVQPLGDGLAAVRVGTLWGVIDERGQYVHKPQFKDFRRHDNDFYRIQNPDGLCGLMNRQGEIVLQPKYGFIGGFQENGFAMIDTEPMGLPPEFWVIDRKGQMIPGPMLPFDAGNGHRNIAFFPKRADQKWGIVDGAGTFVITARFNSVQMLAVGVLGVQEGQKWGMVDLEKGVLIIEPTYYSIDRFSEGLAATRPNPPPTFPPGDANWVGYIDLQGRLAIPNKFGTGDSFKNGIAHVGVLFDGDFDWFYIDKGGRYLWHPDQR